MLISFSSKAQEVNLDSLWGVWNDKTQPDTSRLKAMSGIAWKGYLFSQPDSAFYFSQLLYDFAFRVNNQKYMGIALNTQGISFAIRADYEKALMLYEKSLAIAIETNDKRQIRYCYNNLGILYDSKGDLNDALNYYIKSLEIADDLNDKKGLIATNNNIGIIYSRQANYKMALVHYQNSLRIAAEIGDALLSSDAKFNIGIIYKNQGILDRALLYFLEGLDLAIEVGSKDLISSTNLNIGVIYKMKGENTKALKYFFDAVDLSLEIEDVVTLAISYSNIGNVYLEMDDKGKAFEFYLNSLNLSEETGNKSIMSDAYQNMGNLYFKQEDFEQALEYLLESKNILQEVNTIKGLDDISELLSEVYKKLGKYKQALEMHELYMETKDSIAKMDAEEALYKFEVDKEYQLKKQADSILHADEIIIQQAENRAKEEQLKSEKQRRTGLLVIVGLVLVSLGFVFMQLRKTRAQKVVIEGQHEKLNESHREITDSINYAKRIQDALMTSAVYIKDVLPESFILFNPKDVVSGDFYWLYRSPKGQIYFTVADCTGHGVPGAFMSMIGTSLLNEFIIENNIEDTAEVLTKMREQIIKSLDQKGLQGENKDGMDMALCKYDPKKGTVQYSGAYNPLIHISKNEINQIKGDSQPVGLHTGKKLPFTSKEIQVAKGDMLYIYSDGFPDQFGGEKGKKYLSGKFKKFLLSISDKPIDEQNTLIKAEFTNWIGDHEQIDDVCVMGVRIT